ncbi:MAG: hypothetical protein V4633_22970 [Pseudomonadota bacterium]
MAVWQFKFTVIPLAGILRVHGGMVDVLPEFAARLPDALFDEEEVFPNYWEGIDQTPMHTLAKSVLPLAQSWSYEATMYGNTKTDDIQIWEDSVNVRLDCRNLNVALLAAVVFAASEQNCCLVLCEKGRIISPVLDLVLDAVYASSASRFVKNARAFLESNERIFNSGS